MRYDSTDATTYLGRVKLFTGLEFALGLPYVFTGTSSQLGKQVFDKQNTDVPGTLWIMVAEYAQDFMQDATSNCEESRQIPTIEAFFIV